MLNSFPPFRRLIVVAVVLVSAGCARENAQGTTGRTTAARPWILLVTLDTTRADAVGPDAKGVETKAFNALVARGRRFTRAYAAAPETLPAHTSMMTGLYPAGHGVHENGRAVSGDRALVAEKLQQAGYDTAAFVSSFVLAKRFGLARGFATYDEVSKGERSAKETTDRALAWLASATDDRPRLVWVHYFDAHAPYVPPAPYAAAFAGNPYLGEVAAVDEQLGRLVAGFEGAAKGRAVIMVAGDHGEGLGEHGEAQHGHLIYDATMRVPLVMAGAGVTAGTVASPVSARHVFDTILDVAGLGDGAGRSLRVSAPGEVVLGEGMKPYLDYGWQPQVMAVDGTQKTISAGRFEVYDVGADPGETRDLAPATTPSRQARTALQEYPIPSPGQAARTANLSEEDRRKLASLGYVSAGSAPVVRKDAPRPAEMTGLLETIERASGLFVRAEYAAAIPLFERIAAKDPGNLDALLRLASAHSALGRDAAAMSAFDRARALAPQSEDVKLYLGLHLARTARWAEATPLLEAVLAADPERVAALEGMARVRERQGRPQEALAVWDQLHRLRAPLPLELVKVGELAMEVEDTDRAIRAFEGARAAQGDAFRHHLELGVLYLAARRLEESRDALDRVSPQHPGYAMALFKRAQVAVMLREPDAEARIELARRRADGTTRELIARERLFAR